MGMHKLVLEDTIGYDFDLIALHCSLEEYQLAFLLNKHLNLRLYRAAEDLSVSFKALCAYFPIYHYEDKQRCLFYDLISNRNKSKLENIQAPDDLFGNMITTEINVRLIPELKNVDFLLKITEEGCVFSKTNTLAVLNNIPQIVTAYAIDVEELKTTENLIFA